MNSKVTLFLMMSLWYCNLFAQQIPGIRDSLSSSILKEKRYLQIVLPPNYETEPTAKFDVTYVLDGDWNTKLLSDVEQVLGSDGRIPRNIIVGVINTDRDRDFLPTHNKSNPTSGGADNFLAFFKDELIPYVNKTYRSNGENTLFGHSFGGVFVTYTLLTEPQLFDSYIAGDPAFWWDESEMMKWAPAKLAALTATGKTLYIAGREGDALTGMGILQMDSVLKKYASPILKWKMKAYPDESHGTVRLKSAYDGLKYSYEGFSNSGIAYHPMNGILLKNKPIHLWYFEDTTHVRYTTDGSVPDKNSPLIKTENLLTGPAKVTIRRMSVRSADDELFSGSFVEGDYLSPAKRNSKMKAGGFNYAYYEGQWTKLPDFSNLTPVKSGRMDSTFSIDKMPRQENFGLVISGQLEIKEDGYYIFILVSDDGSKMYLGNRLLIDHDGLHGDQQIRSYIIPLKKGFYPFRTEYFQAGGGRKLAMEYLTPSTMALKMTAPFPVALQYGY
ncbi:MAG: alpha/beta hydrolase-fold protein [Agriterribacter sp.]